MTKSYHLDRNWLLRLSRMQLVFVLVFFAAIGGGAWGITRLSSASDFAYIGCLGILVVWALLLGGNFIGQVMRAAQLVITPEEIEFRFPGGSIRSQWAHCQSLRQVRFGFWPAEALAVCAPVVKANVLSRWLLRLFAPQNSIPVTPFVENWRRMELGQYVGRYLPGAVEIGGQGVFEESRQRAREKQEERVQKIYRVETRVRKVLWVVVGLAMLIACGYSFLTALMR